MPKTWVYSGGPYLNTHFTVPQQAAWGDRPLWIAGYPNYWPPLGWNKGANHTLHQFTDKYQLPGMTHLCDMSRDNPTHPLEPSMPTDLTGCLIGGGAESNSDLIPIYTDLAQAGAVPPIVIGVENPGLCVDARKLGCPTTIARFLNPNPEYEYGGGGRGGWSKAKRLDYARTSIALAFAHMGVGEAQAVDYVQCGGNEWDAQDVGEWTATCDTWWLLLDERDNRQAEYTAKNGKPLRLALGIFNAGTPKSWPMYQAIFSHPMWGRAHAAGDFLGFHEGVGFGQPKDYLYNVPLDGAPHIEGAGLMNFRSDYALYVLAQHGWEMPYGFLEWYDGFTRASDVGPRIESMIWMDQHMGTQGPATRRNFRGYCCFELTNDPSSPWYRQDFTPVFKDPRWKAYAVSQKGRINGTGDDWMANIPDAEIDALVKGYTTLTNKLNSYKTPAWKVGDVALANVNPLTTYNAPGGSVHDLRPPTPPGGPMVTYDLNVAEVSADGLWLRVAAALWVKAADCKHKA